MLGRLDLAAERDFDGVEPDNVDGYTNDSGLPLTEADQLAFNLHLANSAHQRGLAVALKNSGDLAADYLAYYDLELNEECFAYDECGQRQPFLAAGTPVLNVQYADSHSAARC